MKKSFLLGIALCLGIVAFAQRSMEWYSYWGSNVAGNQIEPQRMAVDDEGNIYVAANFGGDKVAVESTSLNSNSAKDKGDAIIVKMSPAKVVQWTYQLVANGSAAIADLAIDHDGNIIAVGSFNNAIRVGDETMMLDDSNLGEVAIYVIKLTKEGEALGAWQIPAAGATAGAVAVDADDNIYVTGLLDGDATFVEGGDAEGDFNNTAQLFVAKYDKEGTLLWHQFRNDEGNSVYGRPYIAVDEAKNFYVATAITGNTTVASQSITASKSNALLIAYSAAGEESWYHMIDGDEADEAAGVAVSPIGEVALALNHHSPDLRIDDMSDVFNNGYAFDPQFAHTSIFSFDLNGEFKWFYDWGYSNADSGSDAICHALRCTDEGVWYVAGMMTGRFGGSRLDAEERTLPGGKNSGVETVDNTWMQHNTNGGWDCYLLTLTRSGKLANVIRPGGPQYERGIDVALSPDKKSLYYLLHINVRDKAPYTCPDNIFDSYSDMESYGRKSKYTLLNVFCPENTGGSAAYGTDYKGVFASTMLVKYAMPEINPNELPNFVVNEAYSQAVEIVNPKGEATLFPLERYADVDFDGNTVYGVFANNKDRYVGMLAIDKIPLPGEIKYYEYDQETKKSVRSNPRNLRYMALTTEKSSEGVANVSEDENAASRKMVREGILFIERNGVLYNAQGAIVK